MPNNRQWAFMFWLAALAIWALSRRDVRSSLRGVLRAMLSPKILMPLVLFAGWALGVVAVGAQAGLWTASRVTDTALWFVTAGVVLFGRFDKVSKDPRFVRRTALATFELSALMQAVLEFFVLNLAAELLIQPVLALLAMLSVVAAQQREHHQVRAVVDGVLTYAGIGLLVYVSVSLLNNWGSLDKGDLAQQLVLPMWLTIGVLPFIYALGLFAAYELAFVRIDWKSKAGRWARLRQKAALLTSFHVKATEVGAFTGPWQFRLAEAGSFRTARKVIADFRRARVDAAREAQEREERLARYAGVEGTDEDGRRLDRREFEATADALRWIGTCQMGWYRNNDAGRYRSDLLSFVLDGYAARRLPSPHGVEMRVSDDGQKWFAWRRTVGGWVFAIGAAGPPPDQWEYDGPEPPRGFPGEDSLWGTSPHRQDANVNW
ncbi:MAG: hypothetical protein IT195_11570 [Microthrixaceae bacterium]|nr:hypothetical protein [Microthrixaceae bacterium]